MELTLDQALQKGIEAHKAGKVQDADRYYTAILKANPKHPDANHKMGVLAVGVGKVEAALPLFKTALEVNSSIAQYWLSYIDALIKLDRMADAKAVFEQARSNGVKGDGFDQIELKLNTSSVEVKNETKEDIQALPNILDELKLEKALKLANKKVKDGLSEEAKKIYQDILEKFPKNKQANQGIKNLFRREGQSVEEPILKELNSLLRHYNQSRFLQALNEAQTLIKRYPNSVAVWNIIGAAAAKIGRSDAAVIAFNKVINIKPNYAEAYYNLGLALKDQGRLDQAIGAYNKALSIKPDFADAYNDLGVALFDQRKLEEAIQAYNKALSIKPDHVNAYNNIGNTRMARGNLNAAIEAFNKALSIKPDDVNAIENASRLRLQISDTKLISEEFEKKLEVYNPELRGSANFQIHQAIGAFLLSDQKLVRKHLEGYSNCAPSAIAKLTAKDQAICLAFYNLLTKLIETPFDNEATLADEQTVFHLGESHCLSYAHKKIKLQGIDYKVVPRITLGGKAFHFSTEKKDATKAITKANFYSLPQGSKVFLSFGEIDCRLNEGFLSAAAKLGKAIETIVSETVEGYVSWFAKHNESKNHSLFFFNVPAPIHDEKYTFDLNKKVKSTTKLFNSLLKKTVLDYGLNLIDVYKFTVGHDEFSNGSFHIDKRHLSSDAIPEIEKQIGNLL